MKRVILAAFVFVGWCILIGAFADELGSWGQFLGVVVGMFLVSAVLPHYFYRGEPLLPDRRRGPENGGADGRPAA